MSERIVRMTSLLKMAAPMKASSLTSKQAKLTKPSQNDLRRLMREKQQSAVKDKEKLDSPLAKYNSVGQLFCVLCNCQVKSEILWTAHVNGRQHKQSLEDLKSQNRPTVIEQQQQQPEFKKPQAPIGPSIQPVVIPPKGILKRKVTAEGTDGINNSNKRLKDGDLPADFFDEPSTSMSATAKNEADPSANQPVSLPSEAIDADEENDDMHIDETNEIDEDVQPKNTVEALPEGFFDDPMVDAKVRKVEYKDPVEEEWEKFQREIAQATNKAQVIIDEDEEESTTERQIVEIDEQINNWARVEALQRRKDELVAKQKNLLIDSKRDDNDDVNMNEHEFEEFLDWRSKTSWS